MKKTALIVLSIIFVSLLFAQTPVNPVPQPLPYAQDFSNLPHASTNYPVGLTGWMIYLPPSTEYCIDPPSYHRNMTASGYADATGASIYNYNGKIGIQEPTGWSFAIVFALNTSGKRNIKIDYDIMTIRNPYGYGSSNHINEATLQYRIGTTGNFTTLPGIGYQNNITQQINKTTNPQNLQHRSILLPAACDNQPELQVRLVSRLVSGSGSYRPSFAIDNIFVTGEDIPTLPVELSSFTATLAAQNLVRLDWTTQSETGALGFYVYRGTHSDPASAILASPLIQATNTSSPHSYSYADAELPGPGTFHYWLLCADQDGGAVWHGPVAMVVSSPEDLPPQEIPLQTGLRGIFPNPFNPLAYIDYYLEAPAPVVFSIYDNRGRLARVLDQGTCPAGHQRVEWDGRDSGGLPCGSGTYHIRMDAGSRSFTAKAALLK